MQADERRRCRIRESPRPRLVSRMCTSARVREKYKTDGPLRPRRPSIEKVARGGTVRVTGTSSGACGGSCSRHGRSSCLQGPVTSVVRSEVWRAEKCLHFSLVICGRAGLIFFRARPGLHTGHPARGCAGPDPAAALAADSCVTSRRDRTACRSHQRAITHRQASKHQSRAILPACEWAR